MLADRMTDADAVVERGDGIRIAYTCRGEGEPAVLLLPTWSVVHSRIWKLQLPYLAGRFRTITFDPRGNGGSSRPATAAAYRDRDFVEDALAVLDATGTDRAVVVGLSCGARWGVTLAAEHPERALGLMAIGPAIPRLVPPLPERAVHDFDAELDTDAGWAKHNRHYWLRDYRGWLEFFAGRVFTEPHSTRPIEDFVEWGLATDAATLLLTECDPDSCPTPEAAEALCRRVSCPVLVVHGTEDAIRPFAAGEALARLTGGRLVALEGCGHAPNLREPVRVNALIAEFASAATGMPRPPERWCRAPVRTRRALMVSSPIGLGHARRDIAIARELRALVPGLEIDWLAQEPVATAAAAAGERVHPASRRLASEAAYIDAATGEHELWVFEAIRRMDEILLANYMVFRDLVRAEDYDVWIGDEAWEVDHFLHENPEDKRAAYVWMSDFVGWLPLREHGEREAFLCADHNAEMIEHVERFPRIRDRAIFVGDPADVVDEAFGPGLPAIGPWTRDRFDFCGHITGFPLADVADHAALRAELGYADGPVCLVTVGGSAAGATLLRRAVDALPHLRERVEGLRMIAITGPRLDPAALGTRPGLEVRGYVADLHRHLAACDVALAQGGLTTCMELVAAQRPFVAAPLARHFEQRRHVRHRLARHGHRRTVEVAQAAPGALADAIAGALAEEASYARVPDDGARRAAALIAELL